MLDRYTARALVEQGKLSWEEYLRLFGDDIRSARDTARAARKHDSAMRTAEKQAGQGAQRGPVRPILGSGV